MQAEEQLKWEIQQAKTRLESKLASLENAVEGRVEQIGDRAASFYDTIKNDLRKFSPVDAIQKRPLVAVGLAVAVGLKVGYRPRKGQSTDFQPLRVNIPSTESNVESKPRDSKPSPMAQFVKAMAVKFGVNYLKKKFPDYERNIAEMEGEFLARFSN